MDLTFSLGERWSEADEPAGIGGTVEFRTDVFDADSVEALIERLRRVLEAMTDHPAGRLSSVDVVDADEVRRWRSGPIGGRVECCRSPHGRIPGMFATQVVRSPDTIAVTFGDRSMTYGELD